MIGNKAKNIKILEDNGFNVPKTYFLNNYINFKNIINNLDSDKLYILRPSIKNEDTRYKSYAGELKSIYPITKEQLINFFNKNKNNIKKDFNISENIEFSIIIQEFLETNTYGVYFTKDPNFIFYKGFYELGETNDSVTSGIKTTQKLSFFKKQELKSIGKKIENIFNFPQDIEFCIKNGNIYILQTRDISTLNYNFYSFEKIKNLNGIYYQLDSITKQEKNIFTYSILSYIFKEVLFLGNIYYKPHIIKTNSENKINNIFLRKFIKKYKKYLRQKIKYDLLKFFIPQKLDKEVLNKLYKNYYYSFSLTEKSNLNKNFDYKTNYITKKLLNIEKLKNKAFEELKKFKNRYIKGKKDIEYLTIEEFLNKDSKIQNKLINERKNKESNILNQKKLIFHNGTIINPKKENNNFERIYKSNFKGYIINYQNLKKKNTFELNILLLNELLLDDIIIRNINKVNGIIIKSGSTLSHPAIWLRENKIPSICNYKEFDNLEFGKFIKTY